MKQIHLPASSVNSHRSTKGMMFGICRLLVFPQLFAIFATSDSFLVRQNGAVTSRSTTHLSRRRKGFSLFQAPVPHVEGLMVVTDFERLKRYDDILNQLRQEFPLLLQKPLSATFLAPDIEMSVDGDSQSIPLASSRDELLRLQQIVILTLRAGNLIQYQPPLVQCQLGCFPNSTTSVRIRWRVDLGASPQQPVQFDGESILELNGTSIQSLRLETVHFNGQQQDAVTIGRFLSSSRRAVQQVQNSPFLQPFLTSLSPLLDTMLSSSSNNSSLVDSSSDGYSSIFMVRQVNNTDAPNTTKSEFQTQWVPLGEDSSNSSEFPLPGSKSWSKYASFHKRASQFCEKVLPVLQDGTVDDACFANKAYLIAKDVRVNNPRRFYQTLAIGRKQSGAQFQCTGVRARWEDNAVQVSYTTSIPSLSSPIRFRGEDVFEFNDEYPVQIANIRQVQFRNEDPSTNWDGALVMRSLAKAVETGRPDTWADLFLLPKSGLSRSLSTKPRSDAAAATIYRIMERMHIDLKMLSTHNETAVIPAGNFLDDTVQLTGYLNETLVKGSVLYSRSVLLAVQSFKAALGSNQIKSKQLPSVRIELTEQGNVRCALTLFLQLIGVPASVNVPLKLQIDFEYVVDPDSGRIVQHRLLESRINGQLTPGDVVSRWIKRFTDPSSKPLEEEDWIGTALETIKWVRSLRPE